MYGLNNLKSSSIWSFPPRPWTSHVRWIEPDKNNAGYIFVATEAGALVQSHDGGRTWIDKVDGGPYDTHTMATHEKTPKWKYSSAGDGYFESFDYGESWKRSITELGHRYHYFYGLAVDSADPHTAIVSASPSFRETHFFEAAESVIYRTDAPESRSQAHASEKEWSIVSKGLPQASGTIVSTLAANPNIAGEFYAVNNRGIFYSTGVTWKTLEYGIEWPKEYLSQHPWALAVQEN